MGAFLEKVSAEAVVDHLGAGGFVSLTLSGRTLGHLLATVVANSLESLDGFE